MTRTEAHSRHREPISLYPGAAPGSEHWNHRERRYFSDIFGTEVVTNVVAPRMTPVLPAHPAGTAVVVVPGGGYHALSIEREGFAVADWLADHGIAAFVLEYRLVPSGDDAVAELVDALLSDRRAEAEAKMQAVAPLAAADAAAALRLVRHRASDFGVDAGRIGMMGFSAGGNVALRVAAGTEDVRADFNAWIYPTVQGVDISTLPKDGGPLFLAAATDDELGLAIDAIELYRAWTARGLSAELHLYAEGGHGFGMRVRGTPSDSWIARFGDWLAATSETLDSR